MKKMILCSALAVAVAFGAFGMAAAEDKGPADITLKSATGKKPAAFPHAKHQGGAMKCDDCHKAATFPADKKWDMKNGHAFCQDCHKKGVDGKMGPTKCADCHK